MRFARREDILTCRRAPGLRLKFGELQQRYDASIGTLREGLTALASEGLVVAEVNRGFSVPPVSVTELLDLTELRVDLEGKALSSAIEHGNDEWEACVLAAFHLLHKARIDLPQDAGAASAQWRDRHHQFHDALVSACTSPWILRFRKVLLGHAQRYQALSMRHSASPGRMDEHRKLMDAVLGRDADKARALSEAHIRGTARTVLASLPGYSPLANTGKRVRRTRAG